jgi:CheY-like chemotaxis protein
MMVLIDRKKMSQVLRNMVSNALKFSPAESTVRVKAGVVNLGSEQSTSRSKSDEEENSNLCLRVEVQDEGPGLTPEQQHHLFKEVIQFNASQLQGGGGSGLGLWLSAAIMEKHGGRMGVQSEGVDGRGSVFFMELPLNTMPLDTMSTCSIQKKPSPIQTVEMINMATRPCPHSSLGSATVVCATEEDNYLALTRALICDDSGVNRKMLTKVLRRDFSQFAEADDGDTALDIFAKSIEEGIHFDAIFMDDGMPRMMGRDAIRSLRNTYHYKGPIIAVTGNILNDDIRALMSAGATAVCSKPLDRKQLRAVLVRYYQEVQI